MKEIFFRVEMVLKRLIKANKRLAERIQQELNFTNYQMLCLSNRLSNGNSYCNSLFFNKITKDITFKWFVLTYLAIPIFLIVTDYGYVMLK